MSQSHPNPVCSATRWSAVVLAVCALGMSGCTAQFGDIATSGAAPTTSAGPALTGRVHGGNQPVTSSTIQLWGVQTNGYGTAAAAQLTNAVSTDSNGGFSITGDYSCPTSDEVYITAAGGNPGLGTGLSNPAIALVAALGSCATMKTNAATTFIELNEVTTVAAVWALQQFGGTSGTALSANSTTPSDYFGTNSTNLQGLKNAMAMANVLADTGTGSSPGANTTGNQANVEYWQIDTIADILAACINTNGSTTSGTNCATLFTNTGGATDTFQAALYMAKNPTANITALTALVGSTPPFNPTNTTTNDFTIGVSFNTSTTKSRWIAIDQFGNAWVTSSAGSVYEFDATGNIIATKTNFLVGTTSTNITTAYEVAIDTANNPWFTDNGAAYIFEEVGSTAQGVAATGSGTGYSTSALSSSVYPEGIAIDGSNDIFAAISSTGIARLASGGTTVSNDGVIGSSPFQIAIDLSNQSTNPNNTISGGGSFIYTMNSAGCASSIGVNGGAAASSGGGSIGMSYTSGSTLGLTPLSAIGDTGCTGATTQVATDTIASGTNAGTYYMSSSPFGIAFDNSNNMWIVNQNYTKTSTGGAQYSLTKMAAQNYSTECTTPPCTSFHATSGAGVSNATPGTTASGFANFTPIPGTSGGLNAPYYLAMDGAGAAWVANSAGAGLSAFTSAGVNISPATGFSGGSYTSTTATCTNATTTCKRSYSSSRGIAIDGSGNIWVANTGASYITVVVGQATPTVTPLSLGIKNGTLASMP
jgi:hypothetical protein